MPSDVAEFFHRACFYRRGDLILPRTDSGLRRPGTGGNKFICFCPRLVLSLLKNLNKMNDVSENSSDR
ncbi:MAG: hypothetical protein EGP82_12780 [Odoribacter splanchnicus]|nr:hypothetical protein [Odoribacter splanchnicus]